MTHSYNRKRPLPAGLDSQTPRRVAMVAACPFPTHQGTQVFIRHLASALANAGHEVHLVTYGYGEYNSDEPFTLHRAANIPCGMRSGPHPLKPLADAALARTLFRVVRQYRCDVCHAHNVEGLLLGAWLKWVSGTPLVYHSHNALGFELPSYYRSFAMRKIATLCGELFDRTLPNQACATITFDADHKTLFELYGMRHDKIFVIPPGLHGDEIQHPHPEDISRLQAKIGEGKWVLYAGNPDGYQNLDLLWSAFKLVRQAEPQAKLLIVTQHAAQSFHIPPDVEAVVLRFHSLAELRAAFAVAQVGVCTRVMWTGTPIKVLNYLAAQLPVVACHSAARHLVGSHHGILADPTPKAFAHAIVDLLQPKRRARLSPNGFQRFRIEAQVNRYAAVYDAVLSGF